MKSTTRNETKMRKKRDEDIKRRQEKKKRRLGKCGKKTRNLRALLGMFDLSGCSYLRLRFLASRRD